MDEAQYLNASLEFVKWSKIRIKLILLSDDKLVSNVCSRISKAATIRIPRDSIKLFRNDSSSSKDEPVSGWICLNVCPESTTLDEVTNGTVHISQLTLGLICIVGCSHKSDMDDAIRKFDEICKVYPSALRYQLVCILKYEEENESILIERDDITIVQESECEERSIGCLANLVESLALDLALIVTHVENTTDYHDIRIFTEGLLKDVLAKQSISYTESTLVSQSSPRPGKTSHVIQKFIGDIVLLLGFPEQAAERYNEIILGDKSLPLAWVASSFECLNCAYMISMLYKLSVWPENNNVISVKDKVSINFKTLNHKTFFDAATLHYDVAAFAWRVPEIMRKIVGIYELSLNSKTNSSASGYNRVIAHINTAKFLAAASLVNFQGRFINGSRFYSKDVYENKFSENSSFSIYRKGLKKFIESSAYFEDATNMDFFSLQSGQLARNIAEGLGSTLNKPNKPVIFSLIKPRSKFFDDNCKVSLCDSESWIFAAYSRNFSNIQLQEKMALEMNILNFYDCIKYSRKKALFSYLCMWDHLNICLNARLVQLPSGSLIKSERIQRTHATLISGKRAYENAINVQGALKNLRLYQNNDFMKQIEFYVLKCIALLSSFCNDFHASTNAIIEMLNKYSKLITYKDKMYLNDMLNIYTSQVFTDRIILNETPYQVKPLSKWKKTFDIYGKIFGNLNIVRLELANIKDYLDIFCIRKISNNNNFLKALLNNKNNTEKKLVAVQGLPVDIDVVIQNNYNFDIFIEDIYIEGEGVKIDDCCSDLYIEKVSDKFVGIPIIPTHYGTLKLKKCVFVMFNGCVISKADILSSHKIIGPEYQITVVSSFPRLILSENLDSIKRIVKLAEGEITTIELVLENVGNARVTEIVFNMKEQATEQEDGPVLSYSNLCIEYLRNKTLLCAYLTKNSEENFLGSNIESICVNINPSENFKLRASLFGKREFTRGTLDLTYTSSDAQSTYEDYFFARRIEIPIHLEVKQRFKFSSPTFLPVSHKFYAKNESCDSPNNSLNSIFKGLQIEDHNDYVILTFYVKSLWDGDVSIRFVVKNDEGITDYETVINIKPNEESLVALPLRRADVPFCLFEREIPIIKGLSKRRKLLDFPRNITNADFWLRNYLFSDLCEISKKLQLLKADNVCNKLLKGRISASWFKGTSKGILQLSTMEFIHSQNKHLIAKSHPRMHYILRKNLSREAEEFKCPENLAINVFEPLEIEIVVENNSEEPICGAVYIECHNSNNKNDTKVIISGSTKVITGILSPFNGTFKTSALIFPLELGCTNLCLVFKDLSSYLKEGVSGKCIVREINLTITSPESIS